VCGDHQAVRKVHCCVDDDVVAVAAGAVDVGDVDGVADGGGFLHRGPDCGDQD